MTSIQIFASPSQFPDWNVIIESKDLCKPIWSIQFLSLEYWEVSVRLIMLLFLFFSFLAIILWEHYRAIRIGVFLSMFFYLSLISSFGKIDHSMHIMLIILFLLIFIPNKSESLTNGIDNLKVFFGIQTLLLLTYFVSGFFKFYGIIDQELSGLKSSLSLDSLAQNLSKTSFALDSEFFLSTYILNTSSPIFPIILIIGYFIEFFSIYVIFKPNLHRIWGLLLIGLHAGILLSIGPNFYIHMFAVGIFLLCSPFKEDDVTSIFGVSLFNTEKKTESVNDKNGFIVYYDGQCLMCNRFLSFVSKFNLPEEMNICTIQSDRFNRLLQDNPDLADIDSIIVSEKSSDGQRIRIKANGIVWVLSKLKKRFLSLSVLYSVFPFIGNSIYDIIAKYRTKTDKDNCPIPPENMRKLILH